MKSWVNPKYRAATFFVLLNAAWMSAAYLFTEREQWLWITPIALSINALLLTYDQVLTFTSLKSSPLEGFDSYGVLKTVHRLSEKFKLTDPRVFLIPHPSAQVFAYARTPRQTRLFISQGALEVLSPKELEAVLTHQILSMHRSVTVINYWVGVILDLFFRVGRGLERGFEFLFGWAPALSVWFIRPVLWLLQFLLLSRSDFEKLDRETAELTGFPEELARALWKMEAYAHTRPWPDAWVFAHMCIVSPLGLHVQPSVKGRITRLIGRYPL